MFTEIVIPWKVLYQRGGERNWVRAVGSSLVGVAIFQAVLTWQFASERDARIGEVVAQWEWIDAAFERTPTGDGRIEVISGMRPEAFAKDYDQQIGYRRLWSAMFMVLGIAIFCCGRLIDLVAPDI